MAYPRQYQQGTTADTSEGPSINLWADCPWDEAGSNPAVGYRYWNDHLELVNETSAVAFTITQASSGIIANADLAGGGIVFDSDGNAGANDGINAQKLDAAGGENWKPALGKTIWAEWRVKHNGWDTTPDQVFVGLCDRETAIITGGTLDSGARNMIGFFVDAGTTPGELEFVSAKAGVAEENTDLNGDLVSNGTFVKLGFKVFTDENQLKIGIYVNGLLLDTFTDTDDIPVLEMALSYVSQTGATSLDAELTEDWVRVFQARQVQG